MAKALPPQPAQVPAVSPSENVEAAPVVAPKAARKPAKRIDYNDRPAPDAPKPPEPAKPKRTVDMGNGVIRHDY